MLDLLIDTCLDNSKYGILLLKSKKTTTPHRHRIGSATMSIRYRYFSQCTCFFTYGRCLGRKFGQSLLTSKVRTPSHPVYQHHTPPIMFDLFTHQLHLSPRAIEKLFDIFLAIDTDDSGEIEIDEYLVFFQLQKSRFAKRAFDVLDADRVSWSAHSKCFSHLYIH